MKNYCLKSEIDSKHTGMTFLKKEAETNDLDDVAQFIESAKKDAMSELQKDNAEIIRITITVI